MSRLTQFVRQYRHKRAQKNAFSFYSVRLPDGSLTIPGADWEMSNHPVFIGAKNFLTDTFGDQLKGKSILDLGCLEGGFSAEFARLGMQATGLEVRTSNVEKCFYLQSKLGLPNLKFVQDDCWNFTQYGNSFDVIFCSGLLYHLSEPRKFIDMMAGACDHLILDTHYALDADHPNIILEETGTNEGLSGRWAREYEDGKDNKVDDARWSSWGNTRSFWPYKNEVLRAVEEAGFRDLNDGYLPRPEIQRFMVTGHR